jgi:hypothetical protein
VRNALIEEGSILDPTGTDPDYGELHGPLGGPPSPGPAWPVPGWREYGSYLMILQAGCYSMRVTWPGGGWQTTFAAGR